MAYFIYKAKTNQGEMLKGRVEAQNIDQATSLLKERNWFIISLDPFQESELSVLTSFLTK